MVLPPMAHGTSAVRALFIASSFFELTLGGGRAAELRLLQWNPHWQCFAGNGSTPCGQKVPELLDKRLVSYDVDFANIVELNISWTPPTPWKAIDAVCSPSRLECFDQTTLVFNSDRWAPSKSPSAGANGCIQEVPHPNRPYIVQQFDGLRGQPPVVVVGAHYSHCSSIGSLPGALDQIMNTTGASQVLLLADTNRFAEHFNILNTQMCHSTKTYAPKCGQPCSGASVCNSSSEIMAQLLGRRYAGKVVSSELRPSCCNNAFGVGYTFPYDRILANFGHGMATTLLDDPAPAWAGREFHKAVLGALQVSPEGSAVEWV